MCVSGATADGGAAPSITGAVEEWNGTSWSTSPASVNTARRSLGIGMTSVTDATATGGQAVPGSVKYTELFNGTSWTEAADQTN